MLHPACAELFPDAGGRLKTKAGGFLSSPWHKSRWSGSQLLFVTSR